MSGHLESCWDVAKDLRPRACLLVVCLSLGSIMFSSLGCRGQLRRRPESLQRFVRTWDRLPAQVPRAARSTLGKLVVVLPTAGQLMLLYPKDPAYVLSNHTCLANCVARRGDFRETIILQAADPGCVQGPDIEFILFLDGWIYGHVPVWKLQDKHTGNVLPVGMQSSPGKVGAALAATDEIKRIAQVLRRARGGENLTPGGAMGMDPMCEFEDIPEINPMPTVAVFDFGIAGDSDDGQGRSVADICREAVLESRRCVLLEREELRSILGEQDLSAVLECDDTHCLVGYGRKLRAEKLILGHISIMGDQSIFTIKILDVESGLIEGLRTARGTGGPENLLTRVRPLTCLILRDGLSSR